MKEIAATECRYVAYLLILSSNQTLDMPIRQHLKVEESDRLPTAVF